MHFTIGQSDFLEALSAVSNIVPARTPLPIIGNVLIAAENDRLSISATDLDLSVTVQAPAGVEEPGRVTLPAYSRSVSSGQSANSDRSRK